MHPCRLSRPWHPTSFLPSRSRPYWWESWFVRMRLTRAQTKRSLQRWVTTSYGFSCGCSFSSTSRAPHHHSWSECLPTEAFTGHSAPQPAPQHECQLTDAFSVSSMDEGWYGVRVASPIGLQHKAKGNDMSRKALIAGLA